MKRWRRKAPASKQGRPAVELIIVPDDVEPAPTRPGPADYLAGMQRRAYLARARSLPGLPPGARRVKRPTLVGQDGDVTWSDA